MGLFAWCPARPAWHERLPLGTGKSDEQVNEKMALIVQKFGGTSVANCDKIRNVARRVMKLARAGHRMVVVLSAMAGETNRFVDLAQQMQRFRIPGRWMSSSSTGEQVTVALFAMAVKEEGLRLPSPFLAIRSRSPPIPCTPRRRIKNIDTELINAPSERRHGSWWWPDFRA